MALRQIREYGDDVLAKECREVKEITPRVRELVEDMLDTMYEANGVGLAAPQVGVLKRIVVIDVSPEADQPLVMINPVIIEKDGEQTGYEGCLSLPGKSGIVTRPNHVIARAMDLDGNEYEIEGEELLARAICHELDHLDGHMYVEKVEGDLVDNEDLVAQQEQEYEDNAE
ncbi:peptide deformylase [Butyrivibrio sp. VCB2001]|jgi:peptide deformylase|uniref:peptide deformylase n=1 Tax=Butyrivibrio sp. VCB2001 TaxID=1280667 RepID=UPI00041DE003|nr:peptide deformylase [Butyrivibrio sp. VCB2001]